MAADIDGSATIREVVAMIAQLESKLDGRLEAHYSRHEADEKAHEADHQRDLDRRLGYMRWAVTTVLTGVGTLFAIVWALVHG